MKKINEIVTSTEKPEQRAKRKAVTFGSFKRAEEKQVAETKKRKDDEKLARIVKEARIKQAIQERNERIDREIREEEERVIKEEAKRKRSEFITESISNAFGTKTEVDYKSVREKVIEQYLPQLREQETLDNLPKPFEAEPALNAELAEFKKKINEHLHKVGFAAGSGGGLDPNKISNHLIPTVDNTFDLGAADRQWRNLYLSGSTLIVDGTSIDSGELTALDGVTAGTVSASKAVIVDANKDITGFRNVTLTGDLTVSGDDITMGTNTAGHIMVADGTNFNPVAVSGDVTLASNGAVTIANTSVTNAMLAGSIANAKLSNSSITVADGSSTTAISLGGTITFSGTTNEVTVGESSGTITVGLPDDVTIAGDLTVNGDTTTVNTATLSVEDPLIKLANGNNSSDSLDVGFYGLYDTSGSQDLFAGLFRDANDSGKFKLFKDLQAEPTTTVNTSGTGYAVATLVANIEGSVTGGNIVIADAGTIGSASDTDAIAIASNGVVTFSQVPVLPDDTIETADIQDNAVTPAKIAGAVNAQTGTTYTLVLTDAFKTVTSSNGSAQTVTIPLNSSVAFSTGDRIDIVMLGSGTTSVTGASGVTLNGVNGGTGAISAQFAAVSCLKIATDTWILMGNHGGVS